MKQGIIGAALVILVALACLLCWLGLLSVAIQPGRVNRTSVFTIDRPVYLPLDGQLVEPVATITGTNVITYVFEVRR